VCTGALSAGIDMALALVARLTDEATARMVQLAIEYDPHPPFGPITWSQVDRDVYEPVLGPMVQRQLADRPELLAKLGGLSRATGLTARVVPQPGGAADCRCRCRHSQVPSAWPRRTAMTLRSSSSV
jgi:hypothetical protein